MKTFTRAFCTRGNWCPEQDDDDCAHCHFYTTMDVPVPAVYRPHRKAVMQALAHTMDVRGYWIMPRERAQAVLGCEDALAKVKRRRQFANGTRLGRWSWARRARTVNYNQALLAVPWAGDIFRRRMCSLIG